MTKAKVKLLSSHDVDEVVKFQQYLSDMSSMEKTEFGKKYQKYMGLSDSEMKAWIGAFGNMPTPRRPNHE